MSKWVVQGLRTGIKTTQYPHTLETTPGGSPGLPLAKAMVSEEEARRVVSRCPTEALHPQDHHVAVDYRRCIHCFRCVRGTSSALDWQSGYEWATLLSHDRKSSQPWPKALSRSLHILVVDAGDCGACLNEVKQLNNPYYNVHRLGFFITPTPRQADILLVVGPVTDAMRLPLQKAYDAMPTPKRVMAVGACALSGGLFGPSFVSAAGVANVLPVDVEVPGSPPPPLAILHGLLVAAGRKPAAFPPPRTTSREVEAR